MAITLCIIYLLITGLVAFNIHRGVKRTKARLTYITWHGTPRFTLRDHKGRFLSNHASVWTLAAHGV